MSEVVEIDAQGRIYLPASIRRRLRFRRFRVEVRGDALILRPVKPAVDKYYGVAAPARYTTPEEVDRAAEEETRRLLSQDLR